jgi:hypothetical protein
MALRIRRHNRVSITQAHHIETSDSRGVVAMERMQECSLNSYCDYGRARSQQLHVIVTLTNAGEVAEWLKAAVC